MFIDVVPNGRSAPAVLLRESYREGRTVKKRTLANLGQLPAPVIEGLRVLLQGGTAIARPGEVFEVQRALPHGQSPLCSARCASSICRGCSAARRRASAIWCWP
jgi:hypothetical protein